jgi:hypothetical protein
MEFDLKYAIAVLLILGAFVLLFMGIITFDQAMALVGAGIGLIGVTAAYKYGVRVGLSRAPV